MERIYFGSGAANIRLDQICKVARLGFMRVGLSKARPQYFFLAKVE